MTLKTLAEQTIDFIISACRRDTRCIGGIERLALCDEVERLRALLREEWQRHEASYTVANTKEARDYHMVQSQRIHNAIKGE